MASEALDKAGLHFDDLNRIRVLDEDTSSQAQELKDVCQDFLGDIGDFQVEYSDTLRVDYNDNIYYSRKLPTVSL